MGLNWLADAEPETFWAHHGWTDFAAWPEKDYAVAILPVHALASHGDDRPLDFEEVVGARLLRAAIAQVKMRFAVRVLPPLRFVPAAGSGGYFALDFETAHELLAEIAAGVAAAGFRKLVFFNTSPGSEPWVRAAATDARAGLELRTYVIHAASLGLDLGRGDTGDAARLAARLAGLLAEIRQHFAPPLPPTVVEPPRPPVVPAEAFPAYRAHYLPALTPIRLASLPVDQRRLAVVPTGAIEQHGSHLPVGTDAILGQALLSAALARLPPDPGVLVAPPVTYGKSVEHQGFPGTISLSTRTLRRLGLAIAGQLRDLGFTRLAFLNTHGGNSLVLAALAREIGEHFGIEATLLRHGYEPDVSPQEAAWGIHAGEWETSLMLAAAPELVRMDRAACEYPARLDDPGELRPEHAAATFAWMTRDLSHSGVMGDATRATGEKGKRWLSGAAGALADKIRRLSGG
ncbi:MAG TPA: creatininase family protein [Opitutaceae bacterium]|nr:creatininase family protein [Opitutaceae bacterium]